MKHYSGIISKFVKLFVFFLLISSLLITSGCTSKEQVSYDFDTYLSKDTDFERNVATVMPSKEELKDSKVVYYLYYDNGGDDESSAKKMIRLTVEYSDENFIKAKQTLEEQFELHKSMNSHFYYNGIMYDGFIFYNELCCALAYHICSDSNSISYIAFDSWDLQFMDVESALNLFPQIEYRN